MASKFIRKHVYDKDYAIRNLVDLQFSNNRVLNALLTGVRRFDNHITEIETLQRNSALKEWDDMDAVAIKQLLRPGANLTVAVPERGLILGFSEIVLYGFSGAERQMVGSNSLIFNELDSRLSKEKEEATAAAAITLSAIYRAQARINKALLPLIYSAKSGEEIIEILSRIIKRLKDTAKDVSYLASRSERVTDANISAFFKVTNRLYLVYSPPKDTENPKNGNTKPTI